MKTTIKDRLLFCLAVFILLLVVISTLAPTMPDILAIGTSALIAVLVNLFVE